jgi:hypothetical protein
LLLAAALGGEPGRAPADLSRLRPGLTAAEVVQVLGPPKRVARQVLYKRCVEQWYYDAPFPLRVELDWVQGRESQFQAVHPIALPRR